MVAEVKSGRGGWHLGPRSAMRLVAARTTTVTILAPAGHTVPMAVAPPGEVGGGGGSGTGGRRPGPGPTPGASPTGPTLRKRLLEGSSPLGAPPHRGRRPPMAVPAHALPTGRGAGPPGPGPHPDLEDGSYVFHFDDWWDPAVARRPSDRGHRLGRTRPAHLDPYTTAGTVEERIREIRVRGELLLEQDVEWVGIDVGHSLTAQEPLAPVGLTPGQREPRHQPPESDDEQRVARPDVSVCRGREEASH